MNYNPIRPPALMSAREIPLACECSPLAFGLGTFVTVELYPKWYGLYLVTPIYDAVTIEEIAFPTEDGIAEPPYVDHVPNPAHVRAFCARKDYHLDELAEELIEGRWRLEVESYASDLERRTYRELAEAGRDFLDRLEIAVPLWEPRPSSARLRAAIKAAELFGVKV